LRRSVQGSVRSSTDQITQPKLLIEPPKKDFTKPNFTEAIFFYSYLNDAKFEITILEKADLVVLLIIKYSRKTIR